MKSDADNLLSMHRMRIPKSTKVNARRLSGWCAITLLVLLSVIADGSFADENDSRRVDISLSIFPRIVAVDNHFREKLSDDKKAYLLFVYEKDKKYAQGIAERMKKGNANIGGMGVMTATASIADELSENNPPTALFIVERLSDAQLEKIMAFSEETNRLVFSPYSGDVERGATVGISVTNRVKPYFNLSALRKSKVAINALLMKMSKRHE